MIHFKKLLAILLLFSSCSASLTWAQSSGGFGRFKKSESLTWAQSLRISSSFQTPDPLNLSCPGTKQKNQDNEYTHSGQPNGNFYCNPLMLEGVAFNYSAFTLESKGELAVIKGDPQNGKVVEIPFYLRLRRNGQFVNLAWGEGAIFTKADISILLKVAQIGDELIIEPVNKEDWPAKRIVKIGDLC
ncbi:MAG: hypothetical protein ABIS36_01305 [Chryseolinea sp.]